MTLLESSGSLLIDPYTGETIEKFPMPIPVPHCCMCGQEVDSYKIIKETKDEITLLAECHGDCDYVTLRQDDYSTTKGLNIAFGQMSRFTNNGRQVRVFHPKEEFSVGI